jgi:hypothetical protein
MLRGRDVLAETLLTDVVLVCHCCLDLGGDGLRELETAPRLDQPILYLQFTNHSPGGIRMVRYRYSDCQSSGVNLGKIVSIGGS